MRPSQKKFWDGLLFHQNRNRPGWGSKLYHNLHQPFDEFTLCFTYQKYKHLAGE